MKSRQVLLRLMLFVTLITLHLASSADTVTLSNMKVTMRDSGYTMGDRLSMKVTFSLPDHAEVDEESLPLVGRVKPWLDIQHIQLEQKKQQVTLDIVWQLFATVEIAQMLKTPEIALKTKGAASSNIMIPAQAFYYSPVLPMPPLNEIKRKPNLNPPLFDTQTPMLLSGIFFIFFGIFTCFLLWLKDLIPWWPYHAGPMTRLYRTLKKSQFPNDAFNQQQLTAIHHALNLSAGVSLYPNHLDQLFLQAPYFQVEEDNIKAFFNQSWPVLYGDDAVGREIPQAQKNLAWIKRIAMAERVLRRSKSITQ
jgi:hypothetical protein